MERRRSTSTRSTPIVSHLMRVGGNHNNSGSVEEEEEKEEEEEGFGRFTEDKAIDLN